MFRWVFSFRYDFHSVTRWKFYQVKTRELNALAPWGVVIIKATFRQFRLLPDVSFDRFVERMLGPFKYACLRLSRKRWKKFKKLIEWKSNQVLIWSNFFSTSIRLLLCSQKKVGSCRNRLNTSSNFCVFCPTFACSTLLEWKSGKSRRFKRAFSKCKQI